MRHARPLPCHPPDLLLEALDAMSRGGPAWLVGRDGVVWANEEGWELLADDATRAEVEGAAGTTGGLEVTTLASGRLVRRRCDAFERRVARAIARWGLTPGQARVLGPVVRGASNKEVAALIGVEETTVEAHVGALFRKSGTTGRSAMLFAFWTGTDP